MDDSCYPILTQGLFDVSWLMIPQTTIIGNQMVLFHVYSLKGLYHLCCSGGIGRLTHH